MVNEEYKFYLAFENSNCRDYITEKLFLNAFRRDDPQHLVIPIVMGGKSRDDYKRIAPSGSYIHVDDFRSPRELAEYLHQIDHNDTLFMSYFGNARSLIRLDQCLLST
ncbi:Glycoprotein 3-alpha-L-fucosyltransferase A, partial [Fragariocoptes setiger]